MQTAEQMQPPYDAVVARAALRTLLVAWLTAWERLTDYGNVFPYSVDPTVVDDVCCGISNSAAVAQMTDAQLDAIQAELLRDFELVKETAGDSADG